MLSKVSSTLGLSSASMAASDMEFSRSSSSSSPSGGSTGSGSPGKTSGLGRNGVAAAGAVAGAAVCGGCNAAPALGARPPMGASHIEAAAKKPLPLVDFAAQDDEAVKGGGSSARPGA